MSNSEKGEIDLYFHKLIQTSGILDSAHNKEIGADFNSQYDKLRKMQSKLTSDILFLERLFYKTHQKLKHYKTNPSFVDIFRSGEYDCVTGTAYYAMLISKLGYDYSIVEFPFHTFLVIQLTDRAIVMDATDPFTGFISDPEHIAKRYESYKTDFGKLKDGEGFSNLIGLKELIGLQYYNLSVEKFNNAESTESQSLLEVAYRHYSSPRIKELSRYTAISK